MPATVSFAIFWISSLSSFVHIEAQNCILGQLSILVLRPDCLGTQILGERSRLQTHLKETLWKKEEQNTRTSGLFLSHIDLTSSIPIQLFVSLYVITKTSYYLPCHIQKWRRPVRGSTYCENPKYREKMNTYSRHSQHAKSCNPPWHLPQLGRRDASLARVPCWLCITCKDLWAPLFLIYCDNRFQIWEDENKDFEWKERKYRRWTISEADVRKKKFEVDVEWRVGIGGCGDVGGARDRVAATK